MTGFALRGRNPDILTCIANLSNDEVFTPPEFANRMLDTLAEAWAADHPLPNGGGASIWADSRVTFLDPCTKSGVFLREITTRLIAGLAAEIPDLQTRVDHILTRQVFGIAITRLTALLARRSLYCSKHATGEHSVARGFDDDDGNIWFERTKHRWSEAKCTFCGAAREVFNRGPEQENHAYAFIHTNDIKARLGELFGDGMQFDVVIGNPPYQLSDGGGGTSAVPIYNYFVEKAKELNPRYLSMIVPSRWFAGGKGLDEFREAMLTDDRCRIIEDFLSASDVFPGVGLKGGVCYFLWDRDRPGDCRVSTHFKDWPSSTATRPLLESGSDVFVRFNEAVPILHKVRLAEAQHSSFETLVSTRRPFGLDSTFKGKSAAEAGDVEVLQKGGLGYVSRTSVSAGLNLIDRWKLFVGFAAPGTGNKDSYPHKVISTPFLGKPGQISSETYLAIGPFGSEVEANNALSYLYCRLTRFLIQLRKASQNTTRKVYGFVPLQDWSRPWSDAELYAKYGLEPEEIAFVEQVVRPMGEVND